MGQNPVASDPAQNCYLSTMNSDNKASAPAENAEASSAALSDEMPTAQPDSRLKRIIKRFGVAGFLFFLIKGVVLYILIPLGLFKWLGGC